MTVRDFINQAMAVNEVSVRKLASTLDVSTQAVHARLNRKGTKKDISVDSANDMLRLFNYRLVIVDTEDNIIFDPTADDQTSPLFATYVLTTPEGERYKYVSADDARRSQRAFGGEITVER